MVRSFYEAGVKDLMAREELRRALDGVLDIVSNVTRGIVVFVHGIQSHGHRL